MSGDDHEAALAPDRLLTIPLSGRPGWRRGCGAGWFDPGAVVLNLASRDRMGAVKELVDRASAVGWVTDSLGFLQSVLDREDLESTVLPGGVAFPHARSRAAAKLGAAVGLSQQGVDFRSSIAGPVHLICLFCVPAAESPLYLSFLAEATARFRQPGFVSELRTCRTAAEMYRQLSRAFQDGRILDVPLPITGNPPATASS